MLVNSIVVRDIKIIFLRNCIILICIYIECLKAKKSGYKVAAEKYMEEIWVRVEKSFRAFCRCCVQIAHFIFSHVSLALDNSNIFTYFSFWKKMSCSYQFFCGKCFRKNKFILLPSADLIFLLYNTLFMRYLFYITFQKRFLF